MILRIPRAVSAYAAISVGAWAYIALVPGLPEYHCTSFPWRVLLTSVVLLVSLARGSLTAWVLLLFADLIHFAMCVVVLVSSLFGSLLVAAPWHPKLWGLAVLWGVGLAVLLSGAMSFHITRSRKPLTVRYLLGKILVIAVVLSGLGRDGPRVMFFHDA